MINFNNSCSDLGSGLLRGDEGAGASGRHLEHHYEVKGEHSGFKTIIETRSHFFRLNNLGHQFFVCYFDIGMSIGMFMEGFAGGIPAM